MSRWRINFILIVFFSLGLVITTRLFYIQIVKEDYHKALAQGFYSIEKQVIGERGKVFLRNGEPLAVNIDWPIVFVTPIEIDDKDQAAEKLAEILALDKEFILARLEKESLYQPIKKRITDQEIDQIKELELKGVYLDREKARYYPQEDFAAQVIGFIDLDGQGQYGIESYYNDLLAGRRNKPGQDIVLTIDYSIQFKAEELLKQAKEDLNIESAEIIVLQPETGEILALACFPSFNPNQYSDVLDFKIFKNSSTQKIFEPGSVFKPITIAGALNEGKITPQTVYSDPGLIRIGGYTINNYDKRTWGDQTMTQVLEKSINTGAVFAERELGHNNFLKYLDDFGFFKSTGIDFHEIYSENKEFKKGYEINYATVSFGQGIEITPMQLIKAFSTIANGGKIVKPYFVKQIIDQDETIESQPKIEDDSILSSKTISQLTNMLVSVTENGFAKTARIPGYHVAGKTGTAQIAWSALGINQRGYSDKTWQSFIGFVPAFNPEFIILVKLDNPQARTAEYSATPIFQELAKHILDYYQVPPDYDVE